MSDDKKTTDLGLKESKSDVVVKKDVKSVAKKSVSAQVVVPDIEFLTALQDEVKLKEGAAPKTGARVVRNATFANYVGGSTSMNFALISAKPLYYIVDQNLSRYFDISEKDLERLQGIGKANIARFYCGKELLSNNV